MGGILLGIATLAVAFVLASYGVYHNVEASQRTQLAMTVNASMGRLAAHAQDLNDETGHYPLSAQEEASSGYANYNAGTDPIAREARPALGLSYRYNWVGQAYYVCGQTNQVSDRNKEAFDMVARDHPGAFVSGSCGDGGAGVSNLLVVSLRTM